MVVVWFQSALHNSWIDAMGDAMGDALARKAWQ